MATNKDYWVMLRTMSRQISRKFGIDLRASDQNTRAVMAVVGAQSAMLLKLLVDKGVITDADIQQAWQTAKAEDWQPELPTPDPEDPPTP